MKTPMRRAMRVIDLTIFSHQRDDSSWNSLPEINDGMSQVRATGGNTRLGGEGFDNRMVNLFADRFLKKFETDLCSMDSTNVNLRFLVATPGGIRRQT
jgi:hypothetical protein